MSESAQAVDDAQFTDKYEKAGRAANFLINGFYSAVGQLLRCSAMPGDTVLEIGCGAGYSTQRLVSNLAPGVQFIASEIGQTLAGAAKQRNPGLPVLRESAYQLAHADQSLDGIVMLEVLEHLGDPQRALAELRRVARKFVIISTPREPLWRALNFARGKYLKDFGNTPGHINHWSSGGLAREASQRFQVERICKPIPWTVLLLRPLQPS
jgi:ubiquinone/menaquinone biosynthesis C-methylase UbiE